MKKQIFTAVLAVVAMVFFFLPMASLAQQATTSLTGVVTDPSGGVLPGASVTLTRPATGQTLTTTTNARGQYTFSQLAPGTWNVTISSKGFADQTKVATLLVSKPATIPFKMSVQALAQTVNVSAETETLNTTDASLGNAISNRTIQSLPMEDRNVPDLLSLQPGVLYLGHAIDAQTDSRTGSVNGVRSDQDNITIDGLDDNDQRQGLAFTGVLRETLDSIDEFRVTTGMANSDQGRAAGAQANLVTKSGTDQFHGAAYEYNRNTDTASNDWFNKNAQLSSGLPNVPGKYIRNTYGADLGGPIKKQKLFFFGNYEASHIRENTQIQREVPTASLETGDIIYQSNGVNITQTPADIAATDPLCAGNGTCPWGPGVDPNIISMLKLYPLANGAALGDGLNLGSYSFSSPTPQNLNTSIIRLDWDPVPHHQLFFRGNLQDDTTDDPIQFPGQPPSYVIRDNSKGLGAGDTWEITNSLVNDFRYGYIRQGYSQAGTDCGAYVQFFRTLSTPTAETCSTIVHVPVQNFVDNVSWTHGNHSIFVWRRCSPHHELFGFGCYILRLCRRQHSVAEYRRIDCRNGRQPRPRSFPTQPPVDSGDSTTYSEEVAMMAGVIPFIQDQFNFTVQPGGKTATTNAIGAPVALNYYSKEFEWYVQDQWKIYPNATLTFGVRQVLLQPPYETHGQQVQPTIDTHQWFDTRVAQAAKGITDQPDLSFAPSGKANGKDSYWTMQKTNFAPRLALVVAPDNKTSIRVGGGMYFDHFGEGIVDTFSQLGSFGLTTSITNPAGQYSVDNAPRFTTLTAVPPVSGVQYPLRHHLPIHAAE